MASESAKTFSDHFKRLQDVASKLQSQKDIDVEQLLQDVKDGTESYNFCKQRIESATEELNRLLNVVGDDTDAVSN
jgi:exodeoxyribonuclease VII small subunit